MTDPPSARSREGGAAPAPKPIPGGRRMRLIGLVRKESLQILRDPSSISIAFVLPVILLLLFGFGISLDAKHVPVALVIENPTSETASFAGSLIGSRYLAPVIFSHRRQAEEAMMTHRVDAMVVLRADFARRLWSPAGAPIQVIVNGTDANTGRIIGGYMDGAWQKWLVQRAVEEGQVARCSGRRRATGVVQRGGAQPQLSRSGPDRDHHDPDRHLADRLGGRP